MSDAPRPIPLPKRTFRMPMILDDGERLRPCQTVRFSSGGVLLRAGTQLRAGTEVTLHPVLIEHDDAGLFELKGRVTRPFEDVGVSAFSEDRFLMGVELDLDPDQHEALRHVLSGATAFRRRKGANRGDAGEKIVDTTVWR